ncbi:MAG: PolC-type DNA polymerase III [Eubacteriales bacterium]|nr:PolC-type DNA polymerase III [Eubacteriales bacterium]
MRLMLGIKNKGHKMANETLLLEKIYSEIPELEGCLRLDKVHYFESKRQAVFFLLSEEPVREKNFLSIKRVLMGLFPGIKISLRTASPNAAERFLKNPDNYSDIFNKYILRKYPAIVSWIDEIRWLPFQNGIALEAPDDFSLSYLKENNITAMLLAAIENVFHIRPALFLRLRGDAEKRLEKIEEERRKEQEKSKQFLLKQELNKEPKKKVKKTSDKIKGSVIKEEPVPIASLTEVSGVVVVRGEVIDTDRVDMPGKEMVLLSFIITDKSSSIKCKIFLKYRNGWKRKDEEPRPLTQEEIDSVENVIAQIKKGVGLIVRGSCEKDNFERGELTIMARDITRFDIPKREDSAEHKRVELHAHTHMSNMDATVSAEDLISTAAAWGHKAIAVTDSGVVQAYPQAFQAADKHNIKLIPGLEAYMIQMGAIVKNPTPKGLNTPIVVLDFETTGLNTREDRITEIGAVKLVDGKVVDSYSSLVNPERPLSQKIVELTGITDQMLSSAPKAHEVLPKFIKFLDNCPIAAHNAKFDTGMLRHELARIGMEYNSTVLDTLFMAQKLYPDLPTYRLGTLCRHLGVSLKNAHRAVHDAQATAECLAIMLDESIKKGASTFEDLDQFLTGYLKTQRRHVVLLAKNRTGIENINRLVTMSHLEHFRNVPLVPKEEIIKHREGLLVGSACEEGEIYQALLDGEKDSVLESLAEFYDYFELQPDTNHKLLLEKQIVKDVETLHDIDRTIISLAEKQNKPVVATGDVHYLEKDDAVFRSILQCSQNKRDFRIQPELYFRTTQEMLDAFNWLGEDKAFEIVVTNPNTIADSIEKISLYPKHPENKTTFAPVWENAEDDVRNMSMDKAHELYGEQLPELIEKRLEKELNAIIGYGYATLYRIATLLVQKSISDGYIVGSRGSVGSSLVATMCGITEVNPLPPHYRCPVCRKAYFDVPEEYKVGVDLPDKACPKCGEQMAKDGFDIPFEVFLGFKGDKVPDIDLNFSGEYQARAHAYVEELFGKGSVFRAGTIGTLQDKTAYGLALKYLRESNREAPSAEVERLAMGCVGVKRTTGQHPGGMVIVPKEYSIYQFTAVQHPADKQENGVVTTHFDFNSMHDILVKLDILGHDDPTMIFTLEKLTGVHYSDIPLGDKKVMTLFTSPEALGVSQDDICCETGTLGVPEFGTPFVRQMLLDTKPKTMGELIRISGLSHGTDVWIGNAKELILSNTAVLSDCICIRDDIMNYLISMGLPAKTSFDIMENVRKGKKLKNSPQFEDAMRENNVPEWFIESCKKIGYLFPKGHAVAYVTMALRIAWFKVYYPLEYYAAYFSIRCVGFNSVNMLAGLEYIKAMLSEKKAVDVKEQSGKDKDEIVALEILLEMYARGYKMLPVDLYKSQVAEFVIEDNALRCPFTSLPGFGEQAAKSIVEQRDKRFISIEDLKNRTRVTNTGIELLKQCGALHEVPSSNQVSLFSLFS